jgi:hypothetical protein
MGRLSLKVVPGPSRDEVVAVDGTDDEAIWAAFPRDDRRQSQANSKRD